MSLSLASSLHQLARTSFPSLSLLLTGWPIRLCHCHLRQLAVIGVVPQWHWPLASPPPPHPCCHHRHVAVALAICITLLLSSWHHRCCHCASSLLYCHGTGHPMTLWLTCGSLWLSLTLVVVAVDVWWWSRCSCGPGIVLHCPWQKIS